MSQTASETRTVNLPERLAELLSETGVDFRADAWDNKAPNQYGVVELTGENNADWADGHMIDQAFGVEITLYVTGNSMEWVDKVQTRLEAMGAGYSLPQRKWLPDIRKTAWVWKASFYGPIQWTEPAEPSAPEEAGV